MDVLNVFYCHGYYSGGDKMKLCVIWVCFF